MQLVIDPHGDVRCVYSEEIELATLGQLVIRRGSHVEPDADGRWWADLSPVQGPRLGPFARRTEALAAERDWLEQHWLAGPTPATGSVMPDGLTSWGKADGVWHMIAEIFGPPYGPTRACNTRCGRTVAAGCQTLIDLPRNRRPGRRICPECLPVLTKEGR